MITAYRGDYAVYLGVPKGGYDIRPFSFLFGYNT